MSKNVFTPKSPEGDFNKVVFSLLIKK